MLSPLVVGRAVADEAFAHWFRVIKSAFSITSSVLPTLPKSLQLDLWGHRPFEHLRNLTIIFTSFRRGSKGLSDTSFEIRACKFGLRDESLYNVLELPALLPRLSRVVFRVGDVGVKDVELRYISPFIIQLREKGLDARLQFERYSGIYRDYTDDWTLLLDSTACVQEDDKTDRGALWYDGFHAERAKGATERLLQHYSVYKEFELQRAGRVDKDI